MKNNSRFEILPCATQYCVNLTIDEYISLNNDDNDIISEPNRENEETICARLDSITGVSLSDHNGHFGPHVFFTLDSDSDVEEAWDEIAIEIEQSIKAGKNIERPE